MVYCKKVCYIRKPHPTKILLIILCLNNYEKLLSIIISQCECLCFLYYHCNGMFDTPRRLYNCSSVTLVDDLKTATFEWAWDWDCKMNLISITFFEYVYCRQLHVWQLYNCTYIYIKNDLLYWEINEYIVPTTINKAMISNIMTLLYRRGHCLIC